MAIILGTNGNNTLMGDPDGVAENDTIFARGGSDTINAGGGDDIIFIEPTPAGDDTINGGAGEDVVFLETDFADMTVSHDGANNRVIFTSTADGTTETVVNVEQVGFGDQVVLIVGAGGYATIQDAVDAAGSGALILVAPGDYVEQVIVDGKDDITIQAIEADSVTIQAPADLVETADDNFGFDINALFTVVDSTNVVLRDIAIDGMGRGNTIDGANADFVGAFYRDSSGGLDNVDVTGIRDPYEPGMTTGGNEIISGLQRGFGVISDNDTLMPFFMTGGSITDFQKNATFFSFADLDFSGVTITGGGAQPIQGQNGIQVQDSTGTISGNTITEIGFAGAQDVFSGAIIGFANDGLDLTGNTIVGANMEDILAKVVGIFLFDGNGGEISGNIISFVDEGIDYTGNIGPDSPVIENNSVTDVDTNDSLSGGVVFGPDDTLTNAFEVEGSDANDVLSGAMGDDSFSGLGDDDRFEGNGGDDDLDGGDGSDTAVFDGDAEDFTFTTEIGPDGRATSFTSVTDNDPVAADDEGADTLTSIERIEFGDGTVFDLGQDVQLFDSNGDLVGTFDTIQEAVDASDDNSSIVVAEGTYEEQVTIDGKNGLSIRAATGADVTILAPAVLADNGESTAFGGDVYAVVGISDSTNIDITGITIDGAFAGDTTPNSQGSEFTGIAYLNSSGASDDVIIQNVGNDPAGNAFGVQSNSGLFIDNTGLTSGNDVSFTNSTIMDFQKTGALILGADIVFNNNTVTGIGATSLTAQNGVQLGQSQGTVNGNTIEEIGYTVPMGGVAFSSTGMFAYEPTGPLTIDGNMISGVGTAGLFTAFDLSDTEGVEVAFTNNALSDATVGIVAASFVGGALGLDANPDLTGNTFANITDLGVFFDPEASVFAPFTTTTDFSAVGSDFRDSLAGSQGDDFFMGLGAADRLTGRDGDDTLIGNAGVDILDGGAGADSMNGGAGRDVARYAGAPVGVTADLQFSADNTGEAMGDTYQNIEDLLGSLFDDTLSGNGGNNILRGSDGDDLLEGRGGDDQLRGGRNVDTLAGGAGGDTLAGGAGADRFDFASTSTTDADRVVDFVSGTDLIGLDSDAFGLPEGPLDPNAFVVGTQAQDADDRIIYDDTTGKLFFDADGNGAAARVQIANFLGDPTITVTDFIVI